MDWESLFRFANLAAMAGWVLLIFGPRRPLLQAVPAYVIPGILSAGYFVLVAAWFAGAEGDYSSLAGVGKLFESEPVRLAGWIHYLAFDLFVGAWIARRADRFGIARVVQAPILAATFLFGPVGLLLFLALQAGAGRRRPVPAGALQ
ncbi:MAG TPA: ABA4-like family protein [Woeseiaceae bacterium]|nr:ABA4-like family protein [Woeseiaceae bacterium]